jgi:hypothetical protein
MGNFIAHLVSSDYYPPQPPPQQYPPSSGYSQPYPPPSGSTQYPTTPYAPIGYAPPPGYVPYGYMPYGYMQPPDEKAGLLTAGGVMYILGAVFLFICAGYAGSMLSIIASMTSSMSSITGSPLPSSAANYMAYLWGVCVILPLIGAIFAILGAVFMFKKTKWAVVMVGGLLGVVAGLAAGIIVVGPSVIPNPIGIIGFVFCLIGLICALAGKSSFH